MTGTSQATITVTDASSPTQTAMANLSITINAPLAITTTSLPSGVLNTPYSAGISVTGGSTPYAFSATGLPTGLQINPSTGLITGTPSVLGTFPVTVTVTDSTIPTQVATSSNLSITI